MFVLTIRTSSSRPSLSKPSLTSFRLLFSSLSRGSKVSNPSATESSLSRLPVNPKPSSPNDGCSQAPKDRSGRLGSRCVLTAPCLWSSTCSVETWQLAAGRSSSERYDHDPACSFQSTPPHPGLICGTVRSRGTSTHRIIAAIHEPKPVLIRLVGFHWIKAR